jgi:hypothetical protein
MLRKRVERAAEPRLSFEQLESRLAMAGVVINEFVADNASGLSDENGDFSDWIELKNTDAVAVDITGWYLTDEATNLTKWQLPATVLDPGEHLVIFASSKNRAVSGQELHTNFSLSKDGEYLGLVMANGTTVASDFGPAFPAQLEDVSYGVGVTEGTPTSETLVGDSTPLAVISPTSANQARDDHWREIGYDDAGWLTGTGSVGFDRNADGVNLAPYINRVLTIGEMDSTDATPQFSAYVRYEFDVANKEQLTSLQLDARFDDGMIVYLNDREIARANFAEDFVRTQPQWDSYSGHQQGTSGSAGAYNRVTESLDLVTWDLTPYLSFLVDQGNVLAFHLVNSNSGTVTHKQDLLVDPVLSAERAAGSNQIGFMAAPTPSKANGLSTLGFVEDTQFSHDRGFYDSAFNLTITTPTAGATIRYTTDGSLPTLSNGTTYAGPISIDPNTIPNGQRGVVMIRAAAFMNGWTSTNVDTQSYVFLSKVILQDGSGLPAYATWGTDGPDVDTANGFQLDADEYDWAMDPDIVGGVHTTQQVIDALKAIPSVSLVTDWGNLWSGAAKPGTPLEDFNNNDRTAFEPQGIYIHGRSDERPVSMEFFTGDGIEQFQVDATFEIQGHSSGGRWNSDKLSFQVKFKEPFGAANLDHPLFIGTADGENATTEFDTLILDAGYNYIWNHNNTSQRNFARFVTDQVVADLQNAVNGGDAPHGKYVHLYLDGMYWGLYNLHERPDEHFGADYYGGNNDDYYVVKHSNNEIEHEFSWVNGGIAAENAFLGLLSATQNARLNPTSLAAYQAVADVLDVDQFIDYFIVHMYAGNESDWPHNNWYATFDSVDPNGKWRFHAWDQEHAFPTTDNGDSWNELSDPTDTASEDATGPGDVFHDLIQHSEFRMRFGDRVQALMRNGGVLTESAAQATYEARLDEIFDAMIAESARWGDNRVDADPYTRQDWIDVNTDDTTGDLKAVVPDFFPVRTNSLLGNFTTNGWLQSLAAPVFNNYGGEVTSGFDVTMTKPGGSPGAAEIYYTLDGSDPRLEGGAANPLAAHSAGPISVDITETAQVKARIKNGAEWSALIDATFTLPEPFPVRITEIHYNPAAHPGVTAENMEFIEFTNTGGVAVDLTGLQITGFDADPYTFGNIVLAAGERIVVARDVATFQSVYGTAIDVAPTGFSPRNLSNGGESIVFMDQSFSYDDAGMWVTSPDGGGPSLEIIDPLGDQASAANWRASSAAGGSPGAAAVTAGDYDYSGEVAVADRDRWATRFGMLVTPSLGTDGNGDGAVNAADYVLWRKIYDAGQGAGGGGVATAAAVAAEAPVSSDLVAAEPVVAQKAASPSADFFVTGDTATDGPRARMMAGQTMRSSALNPDRANLIDALFDAACQRADLPTGESDELASKRSSSRVSGHAFDAEVWSNWVSATSWRQRLAGRLLM